MERRFTATVLANVRHEKRADGQSIIAGYGAVFYDGTAATEYHLDDDMAERIMPGAFDRAIAEGQDVRGLFNHDPNCVLGRTKSKTMRLSIDASGLAYEIEPGNTTVAKDVAEHLTRGDVSGSSFSFIATDSRWTELTEAGNTRWIREILSVDLYDVGPVTFPAYETTTAGVRSCLESTEARASLDKFRTDQANRAAELNNYLMQLAAVSRVRESESCL